MRGEMYTLSFTANWDNGTEVCENQICLLPLISFEGKRVLKDLTVTYNCSRPFSFYKSYIDWVVKESFLRFAFKYGYTVTPTGFRVDMSTASNYNINYYLGALIILRHCVEFPDWTSTFWDERVFNSFLEKPVVRPSNHLVFNRYTPITKEKIASIKSKKYNGVKIKDGYGTSDIKIKHFFNETIERRLH